MNETDKLLRLIAAQNHAIIRILLENKFPDAPVSDLEAMANGMLTRYFALTDEEYIGALEVVDRRKSSKD